MKVTDMAEKWVGVMVSRVFDVYDELEEELDDFVRNIKSKGRGVLLSAIPGIDCRTLAYLLKYHADEIDLSVHMEEESVDEFEETLMAAVDQEMIDAETAKDTIQQLRRLEKENPDAIQYSQTNTAKGYGRYGLIMDSCDEAFAICADKGRSPVVEQAIEYANQNDMTVTIRRPKRAAA